MGSTWAWNFLQVPGHRYMTEEDMRYIPYPATELGVHIGFKNWEAGSLIGGFIAAPFVHWYRKRNPKPNDIWKLRLRQRIAKYGRRGGFIGILITPFMTYGFIKSKNVDEEGLKDRCYRLRYNKKQLLIDRMVFYSTIMGWLFMRWPGVIYATNISVIAGTIYNALLFDRLRSHHPLGGDQMETPDPNYQPKKV